MKATAALRCVESVQISGERPREPIPVQVL
jgi:hypothetical protein